MLSCGSGQVTWFAVNMEWRLIRMLLEPEGVLDRLFENEDNQASVMLQLSVYQTHILNPNKIENAYEYLLNFRAT